MSVSFCFSTSPYVGLERLEFVVQSHMPGELSVDLLDPLFPGSDFGRYAASSFIPGSLLGLFDFAPHVLLLFLERFDQRLGEHAVLRIDLDFPLVFHRHH